MSWKGENTFPHTLGIRGTKCILRIIFDQENRIRALEGKPPITWAQAMTILEAKLAEFASDDAGQEIS